jgi:type VI secretion system protein ImpG
LNRDFLNFYNEELRHIRERATEFAVDHPEIAGRLALSGDSETACPDPFVERLLEGFAFLTARVRLKLEAEYPRFTQGILDTVYPDYMAQWPSAAIVQFTPKWEDDALLKGVPVPQLSLLESKRIGDAVCTFRTAHAFTLHPFKVRESEYHLADVGRLRLGLEKIPPAAFRIRLEMQGPESRQMAQAECDRLPFYLHGKGDSRIPAAILENLLRSTRRILITAPDDSAGKTRTWLGREALRHVGFEEDEAMLPGNPRSFEGHRILREYFLLPQRNSFFEVRGLREAFQKVPGRVVDLIFVLDAARQNPEASLPSDLVHLYCTPAINLFPTSANRVPVVSGMSEFQVIINRTRTLDYEIYDIQKVDGYRRGSAESRPFHPFYVRPAHQKGLAGYYTVFRKERLFSDRERQAEKRGAQFGRQRTFTSRDAYRGSEVYLSIVTDGAMPISPEVEDLQVRALCTNRHLPLDMEIGNRSAGKSSTDFIPKNVAYVESVRVMAGPTPPRPSFAEGRVAWRAVSHLSLNYLSLVENSGPDGAAGAEALRSLLRLYVADSGSAAAKALVEGVKSITSETSLARSPGGGPVAFIRGIDIGLTLEEASATSTGVFPLASVLEQFFARYVSTNHFTRLTLHSSDRPNVMEWAARVGRIPVC